MAWHAKERQLLRIERKRAAGELPAAWLLPIEAEALAAREACMIWTPGQVDDEGKPMPARAVWQEAGAARDVWARWRADFGGANASDLSDAEIKAKATANALEARLRGIGEPRDDLDQFRPHWGEDRGAGDDAAHVEAWRVVSALRDFCAENGVEPPPGDFGVQGMASRVRCPYWWRRALRRMVARRCERGAMALGLVCKPKGQPYASNSAVWRRVDQNRRNARAAERIYFENDAGMVATLAELAARSTSNKAIRRGELMTRISGCEEIADECGHVGLFVTLTNPSRYHATLHDGRRNPKHDGATPRDGQERLCLLWGRARAKLAREGIGLYGFRVAEPHHDGCVHWHALLWAETEAAAVRAEEVLRGYWLSDDGRWGSPSVPEPGALLHRVTIKRMERGGAAGYIAKYVAKNIDDAHIGGEHLDDVDGAAFTMGPDLLGDVTITPSMRVEAWAATWGIRQFQPIGQPPVGVWRELRRVKESAARQAGFKGTIHSAWLAAQKCGGVNASWARYVKAQGGVMQGRRCRIKVRHEVYDVEGLYGRAPRRVPVGVGLNLPGSVATVYSDRRLWRSVESSEGAALKAAAFAAQRAAPRTRVNNCTVDAEAEAIRADFLRGQGGAIEEKACPEECIWRPDNDDAPPW